MNAFFVTNTVLAIGYGGLAAVMPCRRRTNCRWKRGFSGYLNKLKTAKGKF